MKIKKEILLMAWACMGMSAMAGNVNLNQARQAALQQVKQHATAGKLMTANTNLTLAHTETSATDATAADYYVFNVGNDQGWVIIAGEDRAVQVLGYSDHGSLDWNNLPTNMQGWMDGYKEQIEWLRANPDAEVQQATPMLTAGKSSVEKLVTSTWGQEEPYYNQCPTYRGELCVAGCVATAMAQVMNYWNYPDSSAAFTSYQTSSKRINVSALPATTFKWNQMLDSYCYWNAADSMLVQETYTNQQSDAVAELMRYCGQAVRMDYSPNGSGAYTSGQASAMKKTFGYTSAKLYTWKITYTTSQWKKLLNEDLQAMHPVLYSASCDEGGHAFIIDGLDNDGNYHVNWGWYGYGDGYFPLEAMIVVHRDGSELNFNSDHQMILNLVPPTYLKVIADKLSATPTITATTDEMTVTATDVTLLASDDVKLVFVLTDADGNEACRSEATTVSQNTTSLDSINAVITLPEGLNNGKYTLALCACIDDAKSDEHTLKTAHCNTLDVYIAGNVVKVGEPFTIGDVNQLVNSILTNEQSAWSISDVNAVANQIATNE